MAPLILEGETLGQKHHHYNKLVKAAVANEKTELAGLNYEEPDVDNLLKIDVACSRRDVPYVLDVLQSDDMLYVSRAIKQSKWLVTDDQFAHIVNPRHLHTQLFPKMTTRAKNKLLLAIRLNLRNETRVEEFFNYYSDDIKIAQKWLPHCSLAFIEKVYTEHAREISPDTFKRLCETSINVLKILLEVKSWYYIGNQIETSKILLKKYAEEYLEIINNFQNHEMPKFGIRTTQYLMLHCPEKITNNFEKYCNHIHLPTFAKCFKKEEIPDFLLKLAGNKKMKHWIKYDNLKYFVKYLPISTRFEFVKKLFIDKETISSNNRSLEMYCDSAASPLGMRACAMMTKCAVSSSNANIYRWYRFAPFETAFPDLKKLIRVESSPAERNAMLMVLIHSARRNPQHVLTLLQHFREKHMNEPFKFKVQFVNSLLSLVATHKFDGNTWAILNDIFSSMEVYIESENSVPYCVKSIIVYKLLHGEDITKLIEKKHTFDTFKDYYKKLQENERDIIFTYLFNVEINKLNKKIITNEVDMTVAIELLRNILTLLKDWDRKISDYPVVLEKIRYFIKIKKENSFNNDLSYIYNEEKKWRRHLFEESLALEPNDKTCVHALKHDPALLARNKNQVTAMCSNDALSLKHTLSKLRIYWPQTLAQRWTEVYFEGLEKPTGHKATIEGICILLPRNQFLSVLEKYTPVETKIDWSNTDTKTLSLQKNIAKRMKLVRPFINLDAVLSYANGDYLQFAMPSLNAVLCNMSASQCSQCLLKFINSPVSLQKHGLRLAYSKLDFSEIKNLVENMWKSTKNSSIKTVLFKETFELLKKEKNDPAINDLWELLSMFIDNLTLDENRVIYNTLGKVESVPLVVRPQFFKKSYIYLKSLPAKANCEGIINIMDRYASIIIDQLEQSFVEDVLLNSYTEFVNVMIGKTDNNNDLMKILPILTSYVLYSKNEEAIVRYKKYLAPILDACFDSWETIKKGEHVVKNNSSRLLRELLINIKKSTLKRSLTYVNIFKDIETRLRKALPIEENYRVLTHWSTATLFVELLCNFIKASPQVIEESKVTMLNNKSEYDEKTEKENEEKWNEICNAVAPLFGKACLDFINQDITSQLFSLTSLFVGSLNDVFDQMQFENYARAQTLKHMLDTKVSVSCLIVLECVTSLYCGRSDKKVLKIKHEIYESIKLSDPPTEVKIHYYEIVRQPQFEEIIAYRENTENDV